VKAKQDPVSYRKLDEAVLGVMLPFHELLPMEEAIPDLSQERLPVLQLLVQGLNPRCTWLIRKQRAGGSLP
jgi:hypothetical protein